MLISRPFLFVQCRPAGNIERDEKQTIAHAGGLTIGKDLRAHVLLEEPDFDPVRDLDLKDDYSGVIISGSPFKAEPFKAGATATPNAPERRHLHARLTALVQYLLDNDVPTLGLCYGLQMLALASGTSLTDQTSEDLQAVDITITPEGHRDPVTSHLGNTIRAYTGHEDSLASLPAGATLLGRGEHCRYQLVRFGTNIYGTQFHPEITTPGMRIRIDQYGGTYYDATMRDAVTARCMSQDVTSSHRLISAFTDYFRR